MLRRYLVSAEYLRFLEASLVMAITDTKLDHAHRTSSDPSRRELNRRQPSVPPELYDADKVGQTAIIEIGVPEVFEIDETNPDIKPAEPFRVAS